MNGTAYYVPSYAGIWVRWAGQPSPVFTVVLDGTVDSFEPLGFIDLVAQLAGISLFLYIEAGTHWCPCLYLII